MCYVNDLFVQIYMFEQQVCRGCVFESVRLECGIEGEAVEHCLVIFAIKSPTYSWVSLISEQF